MNIIEEMKKKANEALPKWIEEGRKYIHPEKMKSWEEICKKSADGYYGGYYSVPIEDALEVMKLLHENMDFSEIKKIEQNQGRSFSDCFTTPLIVDFAEKGPEYFIYSRKNSLSFYNRKYCERRMELNELLKSGYTYEAALQSLKKHNILDINISNDYTQEQQDGVILLKRNGNFEGILEEDIHISGKIQQDGEINFVANNKNKEDYYFGISRKGYFFGFKSKEKSIGKTPSIKNMVCIELTQKEFDYTNEIKLEEKLREIKRKLKKEEKQSQKKIGGK